jgi:ubiquinone/menaquinone biosynthesis C-methylase UbiE
VRAGVKLSRGAYYDALSGFYDRFVALHSGDRAGLARRFLAERVPAGDGAVVLDLCTGTGTLLPHLVGRMGPGGCVVGLDFSRGMLNVADAKTRRLGRVHLVEGDATVLPFAEASFDAVTCSHAFYELRGDAQRRALGEINRVLKPRGTFLMMEHDAPPNRVVRGLYFLRLVFVGGGGAVGFLRREQEALEGVFSSVEKVAAPAGRSKVMVCCK